MAAVGNNQTVALELEKVLTKIQTLFEREDTFYASIKKGDVEKVSSRGMRIPLELRPGGSFQYFNPNGGDLGRGGGPTWDKALVNAVFVSENIEYTKLVEWGTDSDRKAITNAVRRLTATALDELKRQIDAQLMQAGNGVIGTITSVSTAAGVDTYVLNTDGHGARLMRFGQTIQVFDTTLNTLRGSGVITFHDTDGKTVGITPAIAGSVATDLIVTSGIDSPLSLPALFGVPYHHSNSAVGSWLGFSRASNPEIRASRVNALGAALSLPLPRLAMSKIGNRLGMNHGFKPKIWTHPAQLAAYEAIGQLVTVINKKPSDESLNMYFDEFTMAGAKVKAHYNWNPKRMDFIVESNWGRAEILPIGFYTTDGRKIFEIRGASGGVATADIFYMVNGFQTYVKNPAAEVYIDNLAVPVGY